MKHSTLLHLLLIVLLIGSSTACKKGEDDPFLSLRSRKARVEGTWIIDNWSEYRQWNENGFTMTERRDIADDKINYSLEMPFDSRQFEGPVDVASWFITKDGSWDRAFEYREVQADTFSGGTNKRVLVTTQLTRISELGTWAFLGKGNGYKNKERLTMSVTNRKVTTTNISERFAVSATGVLSSLDRQEGSNEEQWKYTEGEKVEIWTLTGLKHKELKGERETNAIGQTPGGGEIPLNDLIISFKLKQN
ncbi:MAG: hypothetical protein ACFB10_14450 [Salibacteraceae bacterium]